MISAKEAEDYLRRRICPNCGMSTVPNATGFNPLYHADCEPKAPPRRKFNHKAERAEGIENLRKLGA